MATKEHFNYQGITKLATLKNLTNFGLSDSLKEAFPDFNISLIDTMSYNFRGIPHGMWVAGFASGDGSFYTKLTQYKDTFHCHPSYPSRGWRGCVCIFTNNSSGFAT